ncbi:hypothetical protein M422DRAFT_34124 [Sphaerobolus stellatus SS14]|uniref:Uncharacterized protein n=1 Tax=Sphaerobolus stellatus (strain SS14) TaxID=990650 RepID=A0A0C9VHD9_SPHS4|nr:hypothetical protein M422DRAFT_38663 [Sphaerobolus stellatus SS14]KIJ36766.1 hypothetical protein M422DRAFT_34124 [Sphaerobolus stellatus SS14]
MPAQERFLCTYYDKPFSPLEHTYFEEFVTMYWNPSLVAAYPTNLDRNFMAVLPLNH